MYEKFDKLLQERGESINHVAKVTGIPKATLYEWMAGKYTPKIDKIKKIADYFNVPVSHFIE